MKHITPHPKALEILEFLSKGGMSLKFYCKNGDTINKAGRCRCKPECDNSKMKQARKVRINKMKDYGLVKRKNYKATK
jgi:hypothetical protein